MNAVPKPLGMKTPKRAFMPLKSMCQSLFFLTNKNSLLTKFRYERNLRNKSNNAFSKRLQCFFLHSWVGVSWLHKKYIEVAMVYKKDRLLGMRERIYYIYDNENMIKLHRLYHDVKWVQKYNAFIEISIMLF